MKGIFLLLLFFCYEMVKIYLKNFQKLYIYIFFLISVLTCHKYIFFYTNKMLV
jgi:hypothetical protein